METLRKIAKSMELSKKQIAYPYNMAYFIVLFLFTFRFISKGIYPKKMWTNWKENVSYQKLSSIKNAHEWGLHSLCLKQSLSEGI